MANLAQFKEDKKPQTFPVLLQTLLPQFSAALPAHLKANAERYCRVALTEYRKNPKLAECDPYNVLACALTATQLGLEVGLMGQAYLIPFKNRRAGTMECQMIPGYQGLIQLAMRSGMLDALFAYAVFEGDEFAYEYGARPDLKHKRGSEEDPDKITHAYAVAHIKGSAIPTFEVMTVAKIMAIRDKANKIGDSHYSFGYWEEYCRKTAIRRLVKFLPKSAELVMAAEMDELAAAGRSQNISVEKVVTGEWEPEPEDQSPAPDQTPVPKGGDVASPPQGTAGVGGGPTHEQAFALADDACKNGDWDLARSMLPHLTKPDRALIESKLPK